MREAFATQQALQALAEAAPFDEQQAKTLAERHGRAVASLRLAQIELEAKARSLLTPAQREILAAADAGFDIDDAPGGPGGEDDGTPPPRRPPAQAPQQP